MNHHALQQEIAAFRSRQRDEGACSAQRAALQILCGIDIAEVLEGSSETQRAAKAQIVRLIERERLKGVNGHWSYDLNRHIALKQALDRISGAPPRAAATGRPKCRRRPKAPS